MLDKKEKKTNKYFDKFIPKELYTTNIFGKHGQTYPQ